MSVRRYGVSPTVADADMTDTGKILDEDGLTVLLIADDRSPTAWGWVDAIRSAGVTVLAADGRPWPRTPQVRGGKVPVAAARRRLAAFASATPARMKAMQTFRRSAGPSLARLRGRRLRHVVEAVRPDVVHALRIPGEGMVATAACPPYIPLAVSIWGNDLTLQAAMSRATARATRQVLQRADLLMCDCQRDADLAKRWGYYPDAPYAVLPGGGGIQAAHESHDEDACRVCERCSLLGIDLPGRLIVNPRGAREYVRNDTLLAALARLNSKLSADVRVIFVNLDNDKKFRADVDRLGLSHRIQTTGLLGQQEMKCLFRRTEISVSVTSHDGTPNSLLEAMEAGAVPVCGDIAPIREWIEPGKNGYLAPYDDPAALAGALAAALALTVGERDKIVGANRELVRLRADRAWVGGVAAAKYHELRADFRGSGRGRSRGLSPN